MIYDVYNPFLFVLIFIPLIISAAFSVFLRLLCLNLQILRLHLRSSNLATAIDVLSFYYLPSLSKSINNKIIIIAPNLKQKCLSKLFFFFYKFRNKKITSSAAILFFSHSSFKKLSINSFVSGNVLLAAFKTAKAIFSRFFIHFNTARVL